VATAVAALLLAACSQHSAAAPAAFQAGRDYVEIPQSSPAPQPQPQPASTSVLVQEFFWYGCPHCYAFDPTLRDWLSHAPAVVKFERVPATLGRPVGEVHARAFYIAQDLGALATLHPALFAAIHEEHRPLDTMEALRNFFAEKAGIAPTAFDATAASPEVQQQLQRAAELVRRDGVMAVPSMVVDGRYLTDGEKAGSFDRMLKIVDFLIDKVRKERRP
jgi:thiol:disulfide interchange protein DsbA